MKIVSLIVFIAALALSAPAMAQDAAPQANSGFGERLFGHVPVPGFGDPVDDEAKALSEITPAAGDEADQSDATETTDVLSSDADVGTSNDATE